MKHRLILILPISLAILSTLLFAAQGGFGGGHGKFDLAIWILGVPGTFVMAYLPEWPGDFAALVALPAAFNLLVWLAAGSLRRKRQLARRA